MPCPQLSCGLVRFCLSLTRSHQTPDDLTQEVQLAKEDATSAVLDKSLHSGASPLRGELGWEERGRRRLDTALSFAEVCQPWALQRDAWRRNWAAQPPDARRAHLLDSAPNLPKAGGPKLSWPWLGTVGRVGRERIL